MAQTYSIEFKEEACKRVQSGVPAAQVARELGVNVNTLYTWMSRFKEHPADPFVGGGNLHQEDAELRALKKRIIDLEEEKMNSEKSKRLLCEEPKQKTGILIRHNLLHLWLHFKTFSFHFNSNTYLYALSSGF